MSDDAILSLRNIRKRYGAVRPADDFSIDIVRGEFFSMLGPSGSGKSTILRMIAGLEHPDSGEIRINGADVTGVPPWERHLGMVFQQYAIFPHLDVAGNVGYGLRRSGLDRTAKAQRVSELLDLVGLKGFEMRRVSQLSGGEQQRVAIARGLAPGPDILLLDEPLSALDEKIRREMQAELRSIQQRTGTTFVYVTHDQEEALTMSDRIAVLNRGRYVQCGAPEEIFRAPATPFVAQFFRGSNLLDAQITRQGDSQHGVTICGNTVTLSDRARSADAGQIAVRGEMILVGDDAKSADITFDATVLSSTYRGLYTSTELRLPDGQVMTATQSGGRPLDVGARVAIGMRAEDITLLDADHVTSGAN
ncbi:ABC transporter ATP-binding protein [Roseovarius sp. S4756]|uniref:ABC transporter ATP-binding protein n=1 Tax=Roseovarius maritimus TaxID=3342637 RepID=UPI00372A59BD